MRLLVISQYYKPEPIKLHEVLMGLAENGHNVTVITSVPNYPSGNIYDTFHFFKSYNTQLDHVQIYRVPTIPRKKNVLFLILNYMFFAINASIKVLLLGNKFDIVFVYQLSPVTMIFPGVVAKNIFNIPLFVYSLDLWPESMKVLNFDEKSKLFSLVKKISLYLYNKADLISVSSKSFMEYYVGYHGLSKDKVDYFPQFSKSFQIELNNKEFAEKQLNIYYFGNIGLAQDFDTLVDAMINIKLNCIFNFVGSGSYLEILKSKINNQNIDKKFVFHGIKKYEELDVYYQQADVCFLSLKSKDLIGKTLPNKLLEYMAMGKPVIAVLDGDASEVIIESQCGLVSSPGNTQQLSTNIETMYNNPINRNQMGLNGYQYYQRHFTLDAHVSALESRLKTLVGGMHV